MQIRGDARAVRKSKTRITWSLR